ncbi:MAG: hypothetical protein ABFD08_02495 [Syntrophomonas sp.]
MTWNENIIFRAILARPKGGVRFEPGNEFATDLEDAVRQANQEWNGDRAFDVIDYDGISATMSYHSLDPIKGDRTLTRHLQKISQILAYEKQWNVKATRKPKTIFTVSLLNNIIKENTTTGTEAKATYSEEPTGREILAQILEVAKDIREILKNNTAIGSNGNL